MPPKRKTKAADVEDLDYYGTTGGLMDQVTAQRLPKRRKNDNVAEPHEKRQAIFKKHCPKNIEERVDRVRQQRFYMIERERLEGELKEAFKVLGSTGNVYTVTISHVPSCDCPDALKGNHCKHILFIFLKVLGVPESSGHYYQKALLTSELAEVFAAAPPAPTVAANHRVVSAFAKASGKAGPSDQYLRAENRREVDGQNCPICYEEMEAKTEAALAGIVFCDTCNNGLHADCFKMWALKCPVTCVYCRAPVIVDTGSGGTIVEDGYLNLASEAGVSRIRDTSTYYHGVLKGKRRWQKNYYY